ncbi:MAG: hypothetical protein IT374_04120 [Polyangiaceae bacterium]|nr:hypothetical protein [Polyangiaceae bacterium]
MTTREAVAQAATADVIVLQRGGRGRVSAISYPAPVIASSIDLNLAALDVTGIMGVTAAKLVTQAEIETMPTRTMLTLWGSTTRYSVELGKADFAAVPARFVGVRTDSPGPSSPGRALRRGPVTVDVATKDVPGGFQGSPAIDGQGRVVGILAQAHGSDADRVLPLVAASQIQVFLEALASPPPPSASSSPARGPVPPTAALPGDEAVARERARVKAVMTPALAAYSRLFEEHEGQFDKAPRHPTVDRLAATLPDPALYLAPSDLRSLSADGPETPETTYRPAPAVAFEAMIETLTFGGLVDVESKSFGGPAVARDGGLPGTASYDVAHGARKLPLCLVEEHGRWWISPFRCEASDPAGNRRNLQNYVLEGRRYNRVVGIWRGSMTSQYLGTTDAVDAKGSCEPVLLGFPGATLAVWRVSDGLRVEFRHRKVVESTNRSCRTKPVTTDEMVTVLGTGATKGWSKTSPGHVEVGAIVPGTANVDSVTAELRLADGALGGAEPYWSVFTIEADESTLLARPMHSTTRGEAIDLEPWGKPGMMWFRFVGMTERER